MSELESVELPSATTPAETPTEREGLPPSYRMRADAHYVDQLTSRRPERLPADIARIDHGARTEARRDFTDRDAAGEPRHRRSERVIAQLSENIATIQSAAALLAAEASPVARRISLDLIRAHAWRAGWLFQAHQLLDGVHRAHVRPRPIGPLLTGIRDSLAPECRLTTSSLTVHCPDWNAVVEVDEEVLAAGIAGAVLATLELAGGTDALAITVTAWVSDAELRTVEVTQHCVRALAVPDGRAFDGSRIERPGNWTSSLGATVAKSVAHLTGGEVVFLAGEKRGSTVRFTFR